MISINNMSCRYYYNTINPRKRKYENISQEFNFINELDKMDINSIKRRIAGESRDFYTKNEVIKIIEIIEKGFRIPEFSYMN